MHLGKTLLIIYCKTCNRWLNWENLTKKIIISKVHNLTHDEKKSLECMSLGINVKNVKNVSHFLSIKTSASNKNSV